MGKHSLSRDYPYSYPPRTMDDRWLSLSVWAMLLSWVVFLALPIWV